jgi:hypothetical protein
MTATAAKTPGGLADLPIGSEVRTEPYAAGHGLPLFIMAVAPDLRQDKDAATAWLREREATIDALLCDVGAVVLRDFALPDTAAFCQAIDHYPEMRFGYIGGAAPRAQVQGRAFEATQSPAQYKLQFHQEMAYLPHYPSKLAFYCNKPSDTGGETLIADVRRFDEEIPRSFRDEVKRRGVRYARNFRAPDWFSGDAALDAAHKTWPFTFGTTDPREAEAACRAMGMEYQWEDNGSLSLIHTASGFVTHPRTGREIWFNHIPSQSPNPWSGQDGSIERAARLSHLYGKGRPPAYSTTFGDGGPIDTEDLRPIYALLNSLEVAFPWRKGDMMLLDNIYVFHGRSAYTGTRDVQVALIA